MPDLPSRLDLFKIGADYVLQKALRIDPAQVYVQGSDVNIFCGVGSGLSYALVMQLIQSINDLMLDGAEDEALDRWVADRYQIIRKGAAPAIGRVRFWRDTAGSSGTIPIDTKLLTLTGIEYITTTTCSFAVSALENFANVRAVQAGKESQVGANAIRKFSDPTALFDRTLQVTNDAATAHGENVEDDDTFRNRARDFWRTVRRGVLPAIEFGARAISGVESATAVETLSTTGSPVRIIELYIADSSGVASEVMAQQVRDGLMEYRAGGIQVIVYPSMPQIVDVFLRLVFVAGVDTDSLTEIIRQSVVQYINTIPVSAPLTRSAIYSVLQRYRNDGLLVDDSSIVEPAGDIYPAGGVTLRTRVENVQAE